MTTEPHPSHSLIFSFDASSHDHRCENCGHTDGIGTWGRLALPCPTPGSQVAQTDRDAAAAYYREGDAGDPHVYGDLLCGELDDGNLIQAFAAHREASTADLRAEVERLREALQEIAERHIPDQPAAYGGDDTEWATRQHTALRAVARKSLGGQHEA